MQQKNFRAANASYHPSAIDADMTEIPWKDKVGNPDALGDAEKKLWNQFEPPSELH